MNNFGGEIICDSKFGEWTKFSLLFPILDKAEEKRALKQIKILESSLSNDLGKSDNVQNHKIKNILLIDDVKTNIKVLSNEIKNNCQNINIEIMTDAILALELIRNKEKERKQFDLILTDIEMPKMTGIELISNIRNKLYISKYELPIFAYSSRKDRKTITKAKKEGCNAYYNKPEDPIFLSRNIAKWIMNDYIPNQDIHQKDIVLNNKILANYNIIIADDQLMNLTLTAKKLSSHGANVTTCNDGQDIINLITRDLEKYHLIITDINMDNIGGIEATNIIRNIENKNIKQNKMTSKIPIIALSGDYDRKFIINLLNNKIDDYIVKGRNLDDLIRLSKFWIDYRMSKGRISSIN
jgi:two-component system CAI-1 autoinducer sensor kinase/phosphatase CqsS